MPRVLRRSKDRLGYTQDDIEHLLCGMTWLGSKFGNDNALGQTLDLEGMGEAWRELRDTLLPQWIGERPGSRPWCWWQFDSPERRRRVDGKPHPFDSPARRAAVWRWREQCPNSTLDANRLSFGVPTCWLSLDDARAEYEGAELYLERLNLLTASERRALASTALARNTEQGR